MVLIVMPCCKLDACCNKVDGVLRGWGAEGMGLRRCSSGCGEKQLKKNWICLWRHGPIHNSHAKLMNG